MGNGIEFSFGEEDEVYVQPEGTGRKIGWNKAVRCDGGVRCGWISYMSKDKDLKFQVTKAESKIEVDKKIPWGGTIKADLPSIELPYTKGIKTEGNKVEVLWGNLTGNDKSVITVAWSKPGRVENVVVSGWINSLKVIDFSSRGPWGPLTRTENTLISGWVNSLKVVDFSYRTLWGKEYYDEICYRAYEPDAGGSISFNIDTTIANVGDGDHVDFFFDQMTYDLRCSQEEETGYRDQYLYVYAEDAEVYPSTPIQDLYIFMNSMSLIRTEDSMELSTVEAAVSLDFDSWSWGFTATLSTEESYLAVMPTVDGTTEVQLTMNGYTWLFVVENARETIRFGRRSWSISGRSISAELAAPEAPVDSYTETSQMTAVQLMEQAIENTGWTIDFSGVDWLVSADALSYTDKTPIQVVKYIAEAGGCRVQSVRNSKTLNVIPRYNGDPWEWSTATPDLSIDQSIVRSFGHKWVGGPSYQGVYISGTTQGVLCFVIRDGTDGTPLAPMATNALITATEAARELGRTKLAASCCYDSVAMNLPLAEDPDTPAVLLPGTIVQVIETRETWMGQVTSCKISGAWNRGLKIRQNIQVERYYG